MIGDVFGSVDGVKEELAERGAGHFASGWVWRAIKDGKLTIEETNNGDTLADLDGVNPLLVIDLWEHAYYLQYKNVKADYVKAFWNVVNWADVQDRFTAATTKAHGLIS